VERSATRHSFGRGGGFPGFRRGSTLYIDDPLILADRIVVMSAGPGRVKAELRNTLPCPRHVDIQLLADMPASNQRSGATSSKD
jgi:hypothetical protein